MFNKFKFSQSEIDRIFDSICKEEIRMSGKYTMKNLPDYNNQILEPVKKQVDTYFIKCIINKQVQEKFKIYLQKIIIDIVESIKIGKPRLPFNEFKILISDDKDNSGLITIDFLKTVSQYHLFKEMVDEFPDIIIDYIKKQLAQPQVRLQRNEIVIIFVNLFRYEIEKAYPTSDKIKILEKNLQIVQLKQLPYKEMESITASCIAKFEYEFEDSLSTMQSFLPDIVSALEKQEIKPQYAKNEALIVILQKFILLKVKRIGNNIDIYFFTYIKEMVDTQTHRLRTNYLIDSLTEIINLVENKHPNLNPILLFGFLMMNELLEIKSHLAPSFKSHPYLEQLVAQGKMFYEKIKRKDIMICEIKKYLIAQEDVELRGRVSSILAITCPDFDQVLITNTITEYENIMQDFDICENFFLQWAPKIGSQLEDLNLRMAQHQQLRSNFQKLSLKELLQPDITQYIMKKSSRQKLLTLECFFGVSRSQIVTNLFNHIKNTVFKGVTNVDDFDTISMEVFFKVEVQKTYEELFLERRDVLSYDKIATLMNNVTDGYIETEIYIMKEFYLLIIKEQIDDIISDEKLQYLQSYCQLQECLKLCEQYLSLEYLFSIGGDIKEDECLNKFRDFIEFHDSLKETRPSMLLIHEKIQGIKDMLYLEFEQKHAVTIMDLALFINVKELFNFSVQNRSSNYNDLNDDGQQLIDLSVINNMNVASEMLIQLHDQLKQKSVSFQSFCSFLNQKLIDIKEKDSKILDKLQDCINQLEKIRSWYNTQLDTDDNTMQIVKDTLDQGLILWVREDDRYKLSIQVSQQTVPNDKLNQHCGRAILMIDPNQEDDIRDDRFKEKTISTFVEVVRISQEIKEILNKMIIYGHIHYSLENQAQMFIKLEIVKSKVTESLQQMKQQLDDQLQQWIDCISQARLRYYCMNFIPNEQIPQFIKFIQNPQLINYLPIEYTLKTINSNVKLHTINDKSKDFQLPNVEMNLELLIQTRFGVLQSILDEIGQTLSKFDDEPRTEGLLPKSGFYNIDSGQESGMLLDILSLFYLKNQIPQNNQVMFCESNTKIQEIEIFMLRAVLNRNRMLFVLANFQNLPLYLQQESQQLYDQLKAHDTQEQSQLYILFYKPNQKNKSLIEILNRAPDMPRFLQYQDLKYKVLPAFINHKDGSKRVKVVIAQRSGLGKSTYIQNKIESTSSKYVRIPIYGDANRSKIALQHIKNNFTGQKQDSSLGIHYDVYHDLHGLNATSQKESLNIILFDIIFLNSINRGPSCLFNFNQEVKKDIYIEVSESMNKVFNLSSLFLNQLPQVEFEWFADVEKSSISFQVTKMDSYFTKFQVSQNTIQVSTDVNSDIQLVCRYIEYKIEKVKSKDPQARLNQLQDPKTPMPAKQCRQLLFDYFLKDIKQANFYLLTTYLSLVAEQLRRMHNCPNFFASLFFQIQGMTEQIYREIVISFFQVADKLVKGQASQQDDNLMAQQFYDDLESSQVRRLEQYKWSSDIQFVVFNEFHSITPVFSDIKKLGAIATLFQGKTKGESILKPFEHMTQNDFHEKIREMCVEPMRQQKLKQTHDFSKLQFTKDNFVKMALIYYRLKSRQPVIIMGETGVGKTSLVNYLADVIEAKYRKLYLHAGIDEKDIIAFVNDTIEIAGQNKSQLIIMFLDEINTNEHISGLIKEVIIDKCLQGTPLPDNIAIVAACNPYKFKNKKQMKQSSFGINPEGESKIKQSRLVYTVFPLPEAMFSFIWDYGSLPRQEEQQYIFKIIMKQNKNLLQKLSETEAEMITNIISEAHMFTKDNEAEWAVSLRDVTRFTQLFLYFIENNILKTKLSFKGSQRLVNDTDKRRAIVLSLAFCYYFRISSNREREDFLKKQQPHLAQLKIDLPYFLRVLEEEQMLFINQMEIPRGIGLNSLLKENIFAMIICVLNKIPLFIVGKPGSSKSLAISLVSKSFKGLGSRSEFFKKFPSIFSLMYQGSEQSTSAGIKKVFDSAIKKQDHMDKNRADQEMIALVILEEIGLAEISPYNPLKVLHELLENPRVAAIGISNWALDASKRNRAINLQRPDPLEDDLRQSALKIAEDINHDCAEKVKLFEQIYVDWIIKGYMLTFRLLATPFFGLRDFYCFIKQVNRGLTLEGTEQMNHHKLNDDMCFRAFKRNFSGSSNPSQVQGYFSGAAKQCGVMNVFATQPITSQILIEDNITDKFSRNLLINTESFSKTIAYLQRVCIKHKREFQIFYGSDFIEDSAEEAAYKLIRDIAHCMEKGVFCILLNLESIYQSFYDMLNQNYQETDGKLYCKVAIGSDSKLKAVNPNFKCVLLIESSRINKLDLPLLNRFEKQTFTDDFIMEKQFKEIYDSVNQWMSQTSCVGSFDENDMFPMINGDIVSGIIQHHSGSENGVDTNVRVVFEKDQIIYKCKQTLMQAAVYSGVLRMMRSKDTNSLKLREAYIEDNSHLSLNMLLEQQIKANEESSNSGLNMVINYFEAQTSNLKDVLTCKEIKVHKVMHLNEVLSSEKLEKDIEQLFKDKESNTTFIFVNPQVDGQRRLDLVVSIINKQRLKSEKHEINNKKYICLLVRIEKEYLYELSYCEGWRYFALDYLNINNDIGLSINQVVGRTFMEMIDDSIFFNRLIKDKMTKAFSNVKYQKENLEKWLEVRHVQVARVLNLPNVIDNVKTFIVKLIDKYHAADERDWLYQCVTDPTVMVNQTVVGSAFQYFQNIITNYLSIVIYNFEKEGLIDCLDSMSKRQQCLQYLPQVIDQVFLSCNPTSFQLSNVQSRCQYPFSQLIHNEYQKLKENYLNELKDLSVKYSQQEEVDDQNEDDTPQVDEEKESITAQIEQDILKCMDQLDQRIKAILPDFLKSQQGTDILNLESIDKYLNDFCLMACSNNIDSKVNIFMKEALKILSKNNFSSISSIYGIYWRMEKLLKSSQGFIFECTQTIQVEEIVSILWMQYTNLLQSDKYLDRSCLSLTGRDLFVHMLILTYQHFIFPEKSMFQTYFVSKQNQKDPMKWEVIAKGSLDILKSLADEYLDLQSNELQMSELIIDFYTNIGLNKDLAIINPQKALIEFSAKLKDFDHHSAITYIENLVDLKQNPIGYDQIMRFRHQVLRYFYSNRKMIKEDQNKTVRFVKLLIGKASKKYRSKTHMMINTNDDHLRKCQLTSFLVTMIIEDQLEDENPFLFIDLSLLELKELGKNRVFGELITWADQFKNKEKLSDESPFILALADAIENTLPESIDEDHTSCNLKQAIEECLNISKVPIIKRAMSISYVRKVIRQYFIEINTTLTTKDHIFSMEMTRNILTTVLGKLENACLEPLRIFTIKVLNQELDIFKFEQAKEYAPWIANYRSQIIQNLQFYPITIDERISDRNQMLNFGRKEDVFSKLKQLLFKEDMNDKDMFFVSQMILQFFYLNSKNTMYFGPHLELDLKTSNKLGPQLIHFLHSLASGETTEIYQKSFIPKSDELGREIQIFLTYLGAACFSMSEESFLGQIAMNPQAIREVFVPFLANVKEDYYYNVSLVDGQSFKRYRCKSCKNIFIISDCGDISNHRAKNKSINVGGSKCQHCGKPIGFGGESNTDVFDQKKYTSKNFSTDAEAQPSYINLDSGCINDLKPRGLKKKTLLIGHLITHCLLLVSFLFSKESKQTGFMEELFKNQPDRVQDKFKLNRINTIKELFDHIQSDFKELMKLLNFTTQTVQILLQIVVCQLIATSKDKSMSYQNLKKQEGRVQFEHQFEKFIPKDENAINLILQKNITTQDDKSLLITEQTKEIPFMGSILRMQKILTFGNFLTHVMEQEDPDSLVLQNMLEFQEDLKKIKCLKPLLNWANLVMQLWGNKISQEESLELSIREMIRNLSVKNQQQQKFLLIEDVGQIVKEAISSDSSNVEFASLPEKVKSQLNSMLADRSSESNIVEMILETLIEEFKLEEEFDLRIKIKERVTLRNSKSQAGFVKKRYLKFQKAWNTFIGVGLQDGCDEIIIDKMTQESKFQYCCITNVHKDSLGYHFYLLLQHIASLQNQFLGKISENKIPETEIKIELMKLSGKQIIQNELSEYIKDNLIQNHNSFTCLLYGEGMNVRYDIKQILSEFESSLLAGKATIKCEDEINFTYTNLGNPFVLFDEILDKVKPQLRTKEAKLIVSNLSETQRHQLFNDDLRTTINLLQQTGGKPEQSLITFMKAFNIDRFEKEIGSDIKLKHFLHFYEVVEESCSKNLLSKIHPKYQREVDKLDKQQLEEIIHSDFINEKEQQKELKHIKRAVMRLCIRQLSHTQTQSPNDKLFPYLFAIYNEYLFDVSTQPEKDKWEVIFANCSTILISHSLQVYEIFAAFDEEIHRKREEKKKKFIRTSSNFSRHEQSGGDEPDEVNFILGGQQSQQDYDIGSRTQIAKQQKQKASRIQKNPDKKKRGLI